MKLFRNFFIVASGCFLFAAMSQAETVFEKLTAMYDQGTKPAIASFQQDAVWAGKCVDRSTPDNVIGGVLNTFVVGTNDPVVNQHKLWATTHLAPNNTRDDYFLEMSQDQAVYLHNSVRADLKKYTQVADNKPEFNELIFTFTERDIFGRIKGAVDYTLRSAAATDGTQMYVVAGRCPFEMCSGNMVYRDRFMMCYVWQEKLAAPALEE